MVRSSARPFSRAFLAVSCTQAMIKIAHWTVTILILLLGSLHTGIGFYCKHLSEGTLWFIGSGVAILFAGLFNLLAIVSAEKQVRIATLIVNIVTLGLFVYALQVIDGIQAYIGVGLFVLAAL